MIYSIEFRLNKDNAQCKVYQTIMIKCIIKSVRNGESQTNHDKDVPNFTLEHYFLHREKNYPVRHYNAINCDFFLVISFLILCTSLEQHEGYKRTYRNTCILKNRRKIVVFF